MPVAIRTRTLLCLVLVLFPWVAQTDPGKRSGAAPEDEPPRVTEITSQGFSARFDTAVPAPTKILLRESPFPLKTPEAFVKGRWGQPREIVIDAQPRMRHEARVASLKPATRYYYRVPEPGQTNEPVGWSPEYAVNTRAGKGKTECIRVRVKVLLAPNVINGERLDGTVPRPESMPPGERRLYAQAFREASLFFWMNSRMKYWVDFDLYADDRFFRREPSEEAAWYRKLPEFNKDESWRHVLAKQTTAEALYYGEVICEAERNWNPQEKKWEYSGSGGGTYGLDRWPAPGSSFFLGGSDVCWLTCHEFKHQIESQYGLSGLTREDDRMWFCHYAARHGDSGNGYPWKWDTAADHGEHYGGLAWQMRHMTDVQYLRNAFGELVALADRDEDGIPDDAPRLPMDEKRLGSNPALRDTDGDGLDDMGEVLASVWMDAVNHNPLRQRVHVPYIRPGLNKPDSDGDGIPDGRDPYPLYPWKNRVPRGTIQVDGRADDWRDYQRIEFRHSGLGEKKAAVDLEIRACYDDDWLYYAFISRAPHGGIELNTDNDADGYYIGNDNVVVRIKPDGALENVRVHAGQRNCWPYEADDMLFASNLLHAARSEAGAGQVVELAIPKRPDLGLDLAPGEEVGLAVMVQLPDTKARVCVFEPGVIFDSVLDGGPAAARPAPSGAGPSAAVPGSLRTLVDWDSLAVFPRGWKAGMFSSTDPTGKGRDCGNFLRIEGDRYVLAEMAGPGVITRLWSANPQGQLRIELDGRPAVDGLFKDLYEDRYPPFCSPIAAPSSGGFYSYWPIGFAKSCKVTVGDAPGLAERRAALGVARPVRVPMRGVKELKLIVTDGGDGIGADHADWADAKLIAPGGKVVYLSDLTERTPEAVLVSSGQGWGMLPNGRPGPDGALGRDVSCEGNPLSINGKRYRKGLGSHSPAQHTFALRAPFDWFEAEVGIDDSKLNDQKDGYDPSATFEVYADGQKVFDSGLVGAPKLEGGFDPNMFFYQVNYLQLPPGTEVEPFRRELSSGQQKDLADVLQVWRTPAQPLPIAETDQIAKGALLMPPFGTGTFARLPGAGKVTSLRLKVRSTDRHILRRAVLKIFYDGQERPAVWCPVGDFFGCGMGEGEYQTLFLGTEAAGWLYSRFPMPFARGIRLAMENGSAANAELEFEVRYREADPAAVPDGRFCARWHEELGSEQLHPAVRLAGRGNFVGLGLTAVSYSESLGYLEGNEQLIADGDAARALTGTGMEDFFNSGWYYDQGLVSRPLHALLVKSEDKRFGTAAGITSQVRLLLPDRVPFEKGFSATLQHGVNNTFTAVRYATVAYWYQAPPLPGETGRPPARSLALPRRMLVRPSEPPERGADGNNVAGVAPLAGAVFAENLRAKPAGGKAELAYWKDISDDYEGTHQALHYWWPNSKLIDNESSPKGHRGDVLLCRASLPGAQIGIPLKAVGKPGEEAVLTLVLVEGPEFGEVEYSVGSQVLGRHDGYHPFVRPGPILTARVHIPPAGAVVPLVLRTVGRRPEARSCDLGVYCVKIAAE